MPMLMEDFLNPTNCRITPKKLVRRVGDGWLFLEKHAQNNWICNNEWLESTVPGK